MKNVTALAAKVPDYVQLMEPVARNLLGEPNSRLSSSKELRFGKHGSLSVCLESGTWFDHEEKVGGGVRDLVAKNTGQNPKDWLKAQGLLIESIEAPIKTEYDYVDEHGELIFQVYRYGNKQFRQRRPDPNRNGQWINSVKGVEQVPYRLPDILNAISEPVFIVEGEKDADRLARVGLVATCNAGGANKWSDELTAYFKDRDVILVPDNDKPGRDHADLVQIKLSEVTRSIRNLDLALHWSNIPEKADTSDFISQFGAEAFLKLVPLAELPLGVFSPSTITNDFSDYIASLPPRAWIIEGHLLRGYVSAVFAPGGVGKSTFQLAMAMSVASGRDLLGLGIDGRVSTLVINNEDDKEEIERRIAAISQKHRIQSKELKDRFFYVSGYGSPLLIAKYLPDGSVIRAPQVDKMERFIKENDIGAIFIDPYISTHNAPENDNTVIDKVVSQYKKLAHDTRCSISLVHHTKKQGNDTEAHAGDAESGRGASSLKDAARCAVTLAKMNEITSKKIGFSPEERVRHIRLDTGKLNFSLPNGEANWYRMDSVRLSNGDWVGVPAPVNLKPLLEQAAKDKDKRIKWTPTLVAEALQRIMGSMKVMDIGFTEIEAKFQSDNGISRSQSKGLATMISNDEGKPTRVMVNGSLVDYWYSKAYKNAPVVIHRREL